jgi:hypothetical protein
MTDATHGEAPIFANFADVEQHMKQIGDDVLIPYNGNNSITPQKRPDCNLHATDFFFT